MPYIKSIWSCHHKFCSLQLASLSRFFFTKNFAQQTQPEANGKIHEIKNEIKFIPINDMKNPPKST